MKKSVSIFGIVVGIAACAILLTSPVLASAGYSNVYGNANEDDVLDMRDVTYLKLVIFGKKPATTFADANYDGKISMLDIGQTKLIILGKEKQLTLVDQADRIVTVNKPIEKVVLADLLDGVRTLVQLGAADKIVAINDYVENYALNPPDNYPWSPVLHAAPELKELPSVGTYRDPNLELIVSVKPDVIFAYSEATDVANTLQETVGTPVICIVGSGRSFLDFELHRLVGRVVDKEERAEELISYANEEITKVTDVTARIPDSAKPRVYLAFWSNWNGESRTPTRYDPVDLAGGINVAGELLPSRGSVAVSVSIEQIIAWNPDIILIHGVFPPHTLSKETILSDPRLVTVNAIKNQEVNYTKGYMIGWDPAMGLTEAYYMAKLFHPDKFENLDEEKEGNEILKRFYGVDDLYTEMLDMSDRYRWE